MKRITIAAALALALLPGTAYAVDYSSEAAWEAECSGTLQTYQQQPEGISGADFKQQGVVDYNGRSETWYSSNVLRHYRTDEWTADEQGFYHTDEGYYVVASDAYEQGTVIETSRGLAQVLDSGCGENIDFYVDWK